MLVRHGESTWNREHRIQGQLDPPLSAEGIRQAELLGRRLAGRRFAGFYSSDLSRAMQTAQAIARFVDQQPILEASLREIFLGDWEGLTTAEIAERHPAEWAAWVEEPDWDLVPGGEGAAAFDARVAGALDALAQRHPQGDVLVVTHGGVIQVAVHRIVGVASRGLFPFKIQNTSITLVEKRQRTVIGGVNDIAHLEAALVTDVGPG
ncbi:MAG TPA: histidine phosphatase family protein [Candidatus Dormibacteraeota bacterium]|nr:histidine phosphatase family protein [Candidatus Dormibacteraeota bacterium]